MSPRRRAEAPGQGVIPAADEAAACGGGACGGAAARDALDVPAELPDGGARG